MVEILRNKFQWYDDLHNILKCPVCSNCPNSNIWIYECPEGHIICQTCKLEKHQCPTCNQDWSVLRNRLAEDFCSKFQRIKEHLLNVRLMLVAGPDSRQRKKIIQVASYNLPIAILPVLYVRDAENIFVSEVPAASTQTDAIIADEVIEIEDTSDDDSVFGVDGNNTGAQATLQLKDANRAQSEKYPCCLRRCKKQLALPQFVDHILMEHPAQFKEIPVGPNNIYFHHIWMIPLAQLSKVDLVFRIPRVGVFLLKVYANASGDLIGFVSLINNNSPTACCHPQFSYELEVECCDKHKNRKYTGDVQSYEIWIKDPEKKCLKVTHSPYSNHVPPVKNLCCGVVLTRKLCQGGQTPYKKKKTPPKKSKYQRKTRQGSPASDSRNPFFKPNL